LCDVPRDAAELRDDGRTAVVRVAEF